MATERTKTEPPKTETIGFGFEPSKTAYHFVVTIPRGQDGSVEVSEHFVYGEDYEDAAARARLSDEVPSFPIRPPQPKVVVSLHQWRYVADDVRTEFNRTLRTAGYKPSAWKIGPNCLSAHLGKELTLLLWAVEDIDPSLIPNAVANWSGLAPEERWWLYTTINAATGHVTEGRGRGWRQAIGIAFRDNPVTPRYFSQNGAAPSAKPSINGSGGRNGTKANGTGHNGTKNGKGQKTSDDDPDRQLSLLVLDELPTTVGPPPEELETNA